MINQKDYIEPLAVSIERAGELLGISRKLAYEMAKKKEIPTVLIGEKRKVVPVEALRNMLKQKGEEFV